MTNAFCSAIQTLLSIVTLLSRVYFLSYPSFGITTQLRNASAANKQMKRKKEGKRKRKENKEKKRKERKEKKENKGK